MSGPADVAPPSGDRPGWRLDSGLVRLAFGSRPDRRAAGAATAHLAFLPPEALELDLDDPAQREFGDFELVERIGQGGMGVVYRARQRRLDRDVALKLLSAGPWASEEFVAAFRREARNAASLQHPNIVTVYGMGEHEGLIYYAMQLVPGESLAQALARRGAVPAREAAALVRTIAEAVDYAHRLGVLHLDLKPGNILIDAEGVPRVTDFGLARRLGQAPSLENEQVSGTPSYMAPEQARVRTVPLSAATDVWGLGAVLYELLTGRPPFQGNSPAQILDRVLAGRPEPPHRLASVPADLDAICLRCLAAEPAQRYASARALADDLGRFLDGRAVLARPLAAWQRVARWARREPRLATASALALLALVAGLAATTQQWLRAERNAGTASALLWEGRRDAALRLAEAGEGWVALPRLLDNVREQAAAGQAGAAGADRRRIGLLASQGAVLVDTLEIADGHPLAVALSADGGRLAVALGDLDVRWYDTATLAELGRTGLRGRGSSGGQDRAVARLRFAGADRLLATFEWYRTLPGPNHADSWLIDLRSGRVVEPPVSTPALSDAVLGDGGLAVLRDRAGDARVWQVDPWQPLAPARRFGGGGADLRPWLLPPGPGVALALDPDAGAVVTHALPSLQPGRRIVLDRGAGLAAWALAGDGRHAALGDGEGRVRLVDLESGAIRLLAVARGRESAWLAFSEDDAWLAAGSVDGRVHAFDVASGDALVSGAMEHDFAVRRVDISRAQRMLVASGEGRVALWRIPAADGPRALPPIRVPLPPAGHPQAAPYAVDWSWSAGLLASAGIDGQVRLWRLPASPVLPAGAPRQIPERLHFDGRHLVDVEWDRIRVLYPDGRAAGDWLHLPQPPGFAEVAPDGRSLVVTLGPRLQVLDLPSLAPRGPPLALPASPQRLLLSPDGAAVLLDFGTRFAGGFGSRLRLYDLRDPGPLPGEVVLDGPLLSLSMAGDGSRILAIGPAEAASTVLATRPLRQLAQYRHDPDEPVVAGAFGAGTGVWLLQRGPDPRLEADALVRWDPDHDVELDRLPTGAALPYAVVPLAGGVFLPGEAGHLLVDGDGMRRIARAEVASDGSMGPWALSRDGAVLALGRRHEVALLSATGARLGAPLRLDLPASEGLAELAFSPDGRLLLARTLSRQAVWRVAAPAASDDHLAAVLAALDPDPAAPGRRPEALAALGTAARAADPGAWRRPDVRPLPAAAGHVKLDGSPIPARPPGTPATVLDLAPLYTLGPYSLRNSFTAVRPFLRPYPAGIERIAGIDFDMRGLVEAGQDGLGGCLAPGGPARIAAVHALLVATAPSRLERPVVLAELVLRYQDGGETRVPVRATREVPGYGRNDRRVPVAFSLKVPVSALGLRSFPVAAPRLANPEPGRVVRCLDLRSTGTPMLVMGLTVEPVAGAGGDLQ